MRWKILALGLAVLALTFAGILWQRARQPVHELILATYPSQFRCTLYYTPRESGFTAAAGFEVRPETRPGLRGRKFPRDFLVAVEKEGFGRLAQPVDGKSYVGYDGGRWAFAERPVDRRQQPLVARQTCAVSAGQKLLQPDNRLRLQLAEVGADFKNLRWTVTDTGRGLDDDQLDLYWGEDDPCGPKEKMTRPRGAPSELANVTVMVLR